MPENPELIALIARWRLCADQVMESAKRESMAGTVTLHFDAQRLRTCADELEAIVSPSLPASKDPQRRWWVERQRADGSWLLWVTGDGFKSAASAEDWISKKMDPTMWRVQPAPEEESPSAKKAPG